MDFRLIIWVYSSGLNRALDVDNGIVLHVGGVYKLFRVLAPFFQYDSRLFRPFDLYDVRCATG